MNKETLIKTLTAIREDAENDAKEMDGQPFTGKTVATYFGYHGASIATLADILKTIIEELK
ncbi:MAG TPA: hypothetical protein VIJ57_08845 [Hanamia sp.]